MNENKNFIVARYRLEDPESLEADWFTSESFANRYFENKEETREDDQYVTMWAFEAGLTGSEVKAVILNLPVLIGTQELIGLGFKEYRNSTPPNLS